MTGLDVIPKAANRRTLANKMAPAKSLGGARSRPQGERQPTQADSLGRSRSPAKPSPPPRRL